MLHVRKLLRLALPLAGLLCLAPRLGAQATMLIGNAQLSGTLEGVSGSNIQVDSGAAFTYKANSATTNQLLYVSNSSGLVSPLGLAAGLSISGGQLVAASSSSANPSALVGTTAVNGSATSFMRSDAAPAINQAMVPTMTGLWTFSPTLAKTSGTDYVLVLTPTLNQRNATNAIGIFGNETITQAGTGNQYWLQLQVSGTDVFDVDTSGNITHAIWGGGVIPATKGGSGTVSGVLGADGSGNVAAAVSGAGISLTSGPATVSLASIATGDLLANLAGTPQPPVATTTSALLDALAGTTQGSIMYRNATTWVQLLPGASAGLALLTAGSGGNPSWGVPVAGPSTTTQHDVASYSNTTGSFEDLQIINLSSSQATISSALSGANAPLVVKNTTSASAQDWVGDMLMPSLGASGSSEVISLLGVAHATNNAAYTGFRYASSGSATNSFAIGFYTTNDVWSVTAAGNVTLLGKLASYNGIAAAGNGEAVVVSAPRTAANTNALWTPAAYTTPAVDTSYEVSANINVTAATAAAMTCTCTYTDETNTSRVLTLGFTQLSGATILTSITNVTGTGPYESLTYHIRCKASTTVTFATAGTVTGVTYNAEGNLRQIN